MDQKTELVYKGFLALSQNQRAELVTELNKFIESGRQEQASLQENYKSRQVVLGPLSTEGCPCCGKK